MTSAATLFTPTSPPGLISPVGPSAPGPLGSTGGTGAISGGLLRPGSIDQATFVQMLQQQEQNRQAAGVGGKPVSMPVQSFQNGIPNLSSAQFAALVGAANAGSAEPAEAPAADPQAIAAQQATRIAAPMAPAMKLSGVAPRPAAPVQAASKPAAAETDEDAPTITRAAAPVADDEPQITRASQQTAAAPVTPTESAGEKPEASETASKSDPNVVHLKSPPDKDQQKDLRMQNKRWVVDETPGARQLFFGADGEFGWDDFLDMINPLQHIPGIAQIYRAVTGDEINGAANLLGAIPFGPLGGLGLISAVADLAVKDVTGRDIGENLEAMVFGDDKAPKGGTAVPADMAEAGGSGSTTVQTATRETRYALSDARTLHQDCRG
jgi:hypothetical protein